jgi:lysozyme family protein|tara:strand:- start:1074 stop:1586 length:513 start_codon:yes stop_codon:yes gene_type:complete
MISNWQKSFELMLKSEGGYVNNPADPGGMTNLGVTKATWENWVGRESDEAEMRGLTPEKVEPLYKKKYWDAVRGDELPPGISYLCFDFAVNAGAGRSIKTLQTAVGVTPDGGFGPLTLAAVQAIDPVELIEKFSQAKEDFYRSLGTFATFGKGWLNRVADVKVKANSMLA